MMAKAAHQPLPFLWDDSEDLQDVDAAPVPGGLAQGDYLRTETTNSPFTNQLKKGEVLQMSIGRMASNYFCTPEELHQPEAEGRITFRYATA